MSKVNLTPTRQIEADTMVENRVATKAEFHGLDARVCDLETGLPKWLDAIRGLTLQVEQLEMAFKAEHDASKLNLAQLSDRIEEHPTLILSGPTSQNERKGIVICTLEDEITIADAQSNSQVKLLACTNDI